MMTLRTPMFVASVLVASTALPGLGQDMPRPISMSASCSPQVAASSGDLPKIVGGQGSEARTLFGNRESVIIDAGTNRGLQAGQKFYIRRAVVNGYEKKFGRHASVTAGWLSITAVDDKTAVGRIDFACDGVQQGDYLEPFAAPALPADANRTNSAGDLDFSTPGHVLFGDYGRLTGGLGDFMLADIGQDQGATPGARYAVYRDLGSDGVPLTAVGEAILISVGEKESLFRLTQAKDAVTSGDLLIPRKK